MNYIKLVLVTIILIFTEASIAGPILNKISQYLTSLDSVAVEFVQKSSSSGTAYGQLIIKKPSQFRWNYYPPYPLLLVGNKNFISLYDFQMEQLSRIKPEECPIPRLLFSSSNELVKDFTVLNEESTTSHYNASLIHNESQHRVFISVTKSPMTLSRIELIEPMQYKENDKEESRNSHGEMVFLDILSITPITNIASDLFIIHSPKISGAPKQLDKVALEQKYRLAK